MLPLVFEHFLLALLASFALICDGQDQTGYISIDCGLQPDVKSYTESTTLLNFTSDQTFVDTGESKVIREKYKEMEQQQYTSLRSFREGNRNCYKIEVAAAGTKYLIREGFLYGDYDELDMPPMFDIYIGNDLWDSVKIEDSSNSVDKEIIHTPPQPCTRLSGEEGPRSPWHRSAGGTLVLPKDTGGRRCGSELGRKGVEACRGERKVGGISRGRGASRHLAISRWEPKAGVISPSSEGRGREGGPSTGLGAGGLLAGGGDWRQWWKVGRGGGGYDNDIHDRYWYKWQPSKSKNLSTTLAITDSKDTDDHYNIPSVVMSTAATPQDANGSLIFWWPPDNRDILGDEYYFYMHFAEIQVLQANQTREFNIFHNGDLFDGPISPAYLRTTTLYN
ncbi:hypothetical protein TIFTF001_039256 [Ficus carica]|uniref:Malectin-like domain-containing protein n=1 Tax=Ficus carica TaxID=3494 RepID=A0AA88EAG8_FICCA|nr:hypothetical protein TIFTF001_039256 [Ficus carica]